MDIAYSIDENYVGYCLVSICSLLENNTDETITVHILYDDLSVGSINRIKQFFYGRNGNVKFHQIDSSMVKGLILNDWPRSAWYRIFLPNLLEPEVDRVLYLDCDTIVAGSLSELFDLDMAENSLAGCVDIMTLDNSVYERLGYASSKGYICSGVLLLNLDYFRKYDLTNRILSFARENSFILKSPDQDAINYICQDSKILLPLKYETMNSYFRNDEFVNLYKDEFKDMILDPRIIHYAGCPPWFIETNVHIYSSLFWKYARIVGGIKMLHFSKGLYIIKNSIKYALGRLGYSKYSDHCKINATKFAHKHNININY